MGRAFTLSFFGHLFILGTLLLLSSRRHLVYLEEIPRSVRLVATLEEPVREAPPAPKPPAPPPKPAPSPPKPAPVRTPPPPRPAPRAKIRLPGSTPLPALKERAAAPRPSALGERLHEQLSEPVSPERAAAPALTPVAPPAPLEPVAVPELAAPAFSLPPEGVVTLSKFPYGWYLTLLRQRVFAAWKPPSGYYLGEKTITAAVAFRIDPAGRISRVAQKKGSGYRFFDESTLAAVRTLTALPPLPPEYKEDYLDVVIRFQNR